MINRNTVVAHHVSPYKRVDTMHPGRKEIITSDELARSGDREPDPAVYRYDDAKGAFVMKDLP